MVGKVTDIHIEIKEERPIDPLKLVNYLIDWLINHIILEDREIARYFLGMERY